jgi:hypothetical protein
MLAYLFFVQRNRDGALRLLLVTCVCTLVLALPLWTTGASWPHDVVSNIRGIPGYRQPSMFSQLSRQFGLAGSALWLAAFGAALAISLRLWSKLRPLRAALWTFALTTLVSPYIWGWDFVLLLPLFVDTAARVRSGIPRVVLFGFMLLCPVLTVVSIQGANAGNESLWWIPIELTIGILVSLKLDQRMQGSLAS